MWCFLPPQQPYLDCGSQVGSTWTVTNACTNHSVVKTVRHEGVVELVIFLLWFQRWAFLSSVYHNSPMSSASFLSSLIIARQKFSYISWRGMWRENGWPNSVFREKKTFLFSHFAPGRVVSQGAPTLLCFISCCSTHSKFSEVHPKRKVLGLLGNIYLQLFLSACILY